MHEMSIACALLDTAIDHCRQAGYRTISKVRVRVGRAAGIQPDALHFAFDAAKAGTAASRAVLYIESVAVGGDCRSCGSGFDCDDRFVFECPSCGSGDISVARGDELQLVDLEVD